MLEFLEDENVFSIECIDDKYIITECCDREFVVALNRDDFKRLIDEMQGLLDERV